MAPNRAPVPSDLLELFGVGLEAWSGYSAAVWGERFRLSDDDIVKLAPAMARVAVKVQKLEALAKYKDEVGLLLAVAGVYGGRIVAQVMEARAAEEAAVNGDLARTAGGQGIGAAGGGRAVLGDGGGRGGDDGGAFGGARVLAPRQAPDVQYGSG